MAGSYLEGYCKKHSNKHGFLQGRQESDVHEDIIRRMSVKRGAKPLLVKVVANESNGTAEDKETVEGTNLMVKASGISATQHVHSITYLDILFSFLRAECTTVTKQIDKADSDATVNIQDEL